MLVSLGSKSKEDSSYPNYLTVKESGGKFLKVDDSHTFGEEVSPDTWKWSSKEPKNLTGKDGSCMILDGFEAYKSATLPCHLKRRFLCQVPRI